MDEELNEIKKEIESLSKVLEKEKSSKFSCIGCANEHEEILNWLIELEEYKRGLVGVNKENQNIEGYLTLDEAIEHTKEVIKNNCDEEIIKKHTQLLKWLQDLKKYRNKKTL